MYLIGKGHEHLGPGTSMVQRIDWTRDQEMQLMNAARGLGGCGCAGLAGCPCGGLGLFESGIDFSGWSWPEWVLVSLGAYVALSTVFTTQRGAERVRKSFKRYARRRAAE
jgi:hypothetical protein